MFIVKVQRQENVGLDLELLSSLVYFEDFGYLCICSDGVMEVIRVGGNRLEGFVGVLKIVIRQFRVEKDYLCYIILYCRCYEIWIFCLFCLGFYLWFLEQYLEYSGYWINICRVNIKYYYFEDGKYRL